MEELDRNAQLNRETFATFGLAMYNAQCVEKSLAILSASVYSKDFAKGNPDERDLLYDKYFDKTFGQLISELKKKVTVPGKLEENLKVALKKRNWLAHDYFIEKSGEILLEKGKEKMIQELTEISDFFAKIDSHLMSVVTSWAEKYGISEDIINSEMEDFIKETRKSLTKRSSERRQAASLSFDVRQK